VLKNPFPCQETKPPNLARAFLDQANLFHSLALLQNVGRAVRFAVAAVVARGQKLQDTGSSLMQGEEERAREPGEAIVDGLCCLRYELQEPMLKQPEVEKAERWWMASFLKRFITKKPTCPGKRPFMADVEDVNDRQCPEARHLSCYMCPSVTPPATAPSKQAPAPGSQCHQEFAIPFIAAEYKRNCVSLHQAFHQGQMYLTFGAEFLAALGITDYPIWCLVTAGTQGTIIMAWKSTKSTMRDQLDSEVHAQVRPFLCCITKFGTNITLLLATVQLYHRSTHPNV